MTYRLKHSQEQRGARSKDIEAEKQDIEIYSTLLSVMTTEVLFCKIDSQTDFRSIAEVEINLQTRLKPSCTGYSSKEHVQSSIIWIQVTPLYP